MTTNLIDTFLSDFQNPSNDSAVKEGLRRGQDFKALSKNHDMGLLDEICPEGDHNQANPGAGSAVLAFDQDWQQNGAKPFTAEDSVMGDVLKQGSDEDATGEEGTNADSSITASGRHSMTASDVNMRIKTLLHLGYTPKKVTAYLDKLAEQQVFNRQEGDSFLKDQAGLMGFSYLEPNHFNQKSCVASLRHIRAHGQLRAASVKRIAACDGCESCKKDLDGQCKCATYGLPIVANALDMARVAGRLSGGVAKKATLVRKHNGESSIATPGHAVVSVDRSGERDTTQKTATEARAQGREGEVRGGTITRFDVQAMKEAAGGLTPKAIQASLNSGQPMAVVYNEAKSKYGSATAQKVVKTYLDGLKKTGARINLAALDCKLLKHRLTASETIIGKTACATCDARQGMHCGRTGGTLLSFPGMETINAKRASMRSGGQDGVDFMNQIELQAPVLVVPIGKDRDLAPVEMPSQPLLTW